ncbi:hypothetical protein EPR50_G00224610 [Perca flavescens]|uniref:GRAM domain-containing protein n=1 Tax=Perca flavescens TaxID=8167 RepID=A0A484C5L0_PERFV|nr:hypothetical protein EPR50_G00224610 [Perca flavescens]
MRCTCNKTHEHNIKLISRASELCGTNCRVLAFLKIELFFLTWSHYNRTEILGPLRASTAEQMDQVSNRSGVGSDDVTDESTSVRWSSDEESSEPQGQCLAAPQAPLPTYKQRLDEFRKLFKELPESERLIVDYPCALQRDILLQGRLYLTENWLCFYSNVFRGTKITLTLKDLITMTREKTARLIPNAIQVCTSTDKFFFTSFSAREKSYQGYGSPSDSQLKLTAAEKCPLTPSDQLGVVADN